MPSFKIIPQLAKNHKNYLKKFLSIKHVNFENYIDEISDIENKLRENVNLPIGEHGEYFTSYHEIRTNDNFLPYPIDNSYYCPFYIDSKGKKLIIDDIDIPPEENFEWLEFIENKLLKIWGYELEHGIEEFKDKLEREINDEESESESSNSDSGDNFDSDDSCNCCENDCDNSEIEKDHIEELLKTEHIHVSFNEVEMFGNNSKFVINMDDKFYKIYKNNNLLFVNNNLHRFNQINNYFMINLESAINQKFIEKLKQNKLSPLIEHQFNKIDEIIFLNTCEICLENFKDNEKLKKLPCNHYLHE